jgi:hypothetical protein
LPDLARQDVGKGCDAIGEEILLHEPALRAPSRAVAGEQAVAEHHSDERGAAVVFAVKDGLNMLRVDEEDAGPHAGGVTDDVAVIADEITEEGERVDV